ncbi:UNVERIFIED_CONTAM: hypothetical protein Sindi_2464400 [Sesamum indicum]
MWHSCSIRTEVSPKSNEKEYMQLLNQHVLCHLVITLIVLKDHCTELMSIEVPTDTSEILEPESEASAVITTTTKSFWDIAIDNSLASSPVNSVSKNGKIGNGKPAKSVTFKPTLSILVLIIAVIVGLVFYVTGR